MAEHSTVAIANAPAPASEGGEPAASGGAGKDDKVKLKDKTTKAERRAKQEAQRALKAERMVAEGKQPPKKGPSKGQKEKEASAAASMTGGNAAGAVAAASKAVASTGALAQAQEGKGKGKKQDKFKTAQRPREEKCGLLSHLYVHSRNFPVTSGLTFSKSSELNETVIQLGLMYSDYRIRGSNDRCVALLEALKDLIHRYTTPKEKVMARDFESKLKPQISFLNKCRLLSPSMGNAIRHFKVLISQLPPDMPEEQAKVSLLIELDNYKREKIVVADVAIVKYGVAMISNGDTIMTFAHSSIVRKMLCAAHKNGKKFRVMVVDSRPFYEGRTMLEALQAAGIPCAYIYLNAISYVMKAVTKVIIGASTMTTNGHCVSRVGTAVVAMMAKGHGVPVLVACETYKFSDRVQTDAFVFNELGDPLDLVATEVPHGNCAPVPDADAKLGDYGSNPQLNVVNLLYDVTPANYISIMLTEVGPLPCSSVPLVLRVKTVA